MNDAHCHFFSTAFFAALATQRAGTGLKTRPYNDQTTGHDDVGAGLQTGPSDLCRELQWDDPGTPEVLADRWVRELDTHGVSRAALLASIPGDEASVAAAVSRHPSRVVGFFMVDPAAIDAPDRVRRALTEQGLKAVCLFPAMHHVPLHDERTQRVVEAAAAAKAAVFVHCGVLSVGVRRKLGLPSRFDLRLGDPLAVSRLALTFPETPFIVPHFGAGLFREALMAADACSNVHFDTSSSNNWIRYTPGLTLDAVFKTSLAVLGPSRLLFGTDSSFFPRGWQKGIYEQQKAIVDGLGVTEGDAALIFGGNFDRLFK